MTPALKIGAHPDRFPKGLLILGERRFPFHPSDGDNPATPTHNLSDWNEPPNVRAATSMPSTLLLPPVSDFRALEGPLIRRAAENAVVTGGTSGIGRSLVEVLWNELGFSVATCGRKADAIRDLETRFPGIYAPQIDLTEHKALVPEEEQWRNPLLFFANNAGYLFGQQALQSLGKLHLLILNAGISGLKPGEKLTDVVDAKTGETRFDRWLDSTLGTYVALEDTLRENNGTVVFISTPIVHQWHHMPGGVPEAVQPYFNLKEAIRQHLYRISSRRDGPYDYDTRQGLKLLFIEPGSVDTVMHQQTLESDPALALRTLKLKAEHKLREPALVARILLRMALRGVAFTTHEDADPNAPQGPSGSEARAPDYSSKIGPANWVYEITDAAYAFEKQNRQRPLLDSWWFDSGARTKKQ